MAGATPRSSEPTTLTFGQRLRALREAAGLSQEELAEHARVSTDAVGALERGTRARPYPATVRALADALGLSPREHSSLAALVPKRLPAAGGRTGAGSRAACLPRPATPLLGRERDVAAVIALLARPSVRLVTLTGTGGIGKTRLAVAAAEKLGSTMADGSAFVPLAPVLDEALVWPEVGRALGVDTPGRAGGAEEVLRVSASLQVLLVLDNCEHLPGAASIVADLLDRCRDMTLLVTSRAPLRLRAETEYLVPPLELPQLGSPALTAVSASPAASLLVERGRAVRRDFVVGAEDSEAVAKICHRLGGIPLALELAAVGLRVLDPAALLDRLDAVLTGGGPVDLPPRQRTLRATLDWSYGLLSQRDRAVFRRTSVFVGGFTLAAAEAVVGGTDLLGAIERLTAQSLCTATRSDRGGLRYAMLEPVAQYAGSLLTGEERASTQAAHAEYFLEEIERAEQTLLGAGQLEALRLFDTEESNLWSALDWAIGAGQSDLAGRLTWASFIFWWTRGRRERGRQLAAQVLTLELPDALRARALHVAAALSDPQEQPPEVVERLYLDSVALAQACGDQGVEAPSAIGAGLIAVERGDPGTAERRLRGALVAAQRSGEKGQWSAGLAHAWLAMTRRFQGDAPGAVAHAHEALAIIRRRGDMLSECIALYNLANAELCLRQLDEAREHLLEAVTLCQRTRDASNLSYVLDALAAVELASAGGTGRVVTLLGAAEALREAVGSVVYRWYEPDVTVRRRTAEHARRRLGQEAYERALDAGRSLTLDGAAELARRQVPARS